MTKTEKQLAWSAAIVGGLLFFSRKKRRAGQEAEGRKKTRESKTAEDRAKSEKAESERQAKQKEEEKAKRGTDPARDAVALTSAEEFFLAALARGEDYATAEASAIEAYRAAEGSLAKNELQGHLRSENARIEKAEEAYVAAIAGGVGSDIAEDAAITAYRSMPSAEAGHYTENELRSYLRAALAGTVPAPEPPDAGLRPPSQPGLPTTPEGVREPPI
jgi:hypothetical protein